MKELKDYKKEHLIKSHEKTKKRAQKLRKKLGKDAPPKPVPRKESQLEKDQKYERGLAKRAESGDKNAIRSLRRMKMIQELDKRKKK